MNNKENTLPVLRTENHNENSSITDQDSLKGLIKGNVTSQQTRSKTHYVKIETNEKAKANDVKGKTATENNTKNQNTTKKNFAELNKSASPTGSPILTKGTKKPSFHIQTELERCETVVAESTPVSRHRHAVTIHHQVVKKLQGPAVVVEITNAQELIEKLNHLKQQRDTKQNKLQEIREKKQIAIRTRATIKKRIDKLKIEIKEQEEIQEELLSIINPIEENASRAESLKKKQDLVEELLNTLSFLHYQIQELKEQKDQKV
ncbi:hypothetical protein BDF21DRAFT_494179 [Thamnidium elegans]|uniref:Uncharacterized protein n=1 Tax=Thamnidium elegans TaxID=101142 RepID=A0A8H7W3N2_9FUNG|nr:hypothetical protein INT48_009497 [Thamnidium elegans]KAI8078448.1 hypothetical protein BDF21DRAFT_494179 [Thamnidium elegans]